MRTAVTTGAVSRTGTLRRLAVAGVAGALLATLPAGVASADDHRTWVVLPGQSIQAAVDQAVSGDTIRIEAGTYQEAVCVQGKGLNVLGAGRDRTTITWPDWGGSTAMPEVASNPCWDAQELSDYEDDPTTLADDVSGLFFLYPDSPVTVRDIGTRNHPAHGIAAWGADGFAVENTVGVGHERYGVLAAASRHIGIEGNLEYGVDRGWPWFAGTAGVSVGDSDGADATISGNTVEGYNLGVFAKESRGGTIEGNTLVGNCAGVLVFDDSATEVPDTTRHVEGGGWRVTSNYSSFNSRYCLVGRDGSQRVSGVGIAVTNADHVSIKGNTLEGNRPVVPAGLEPVNFPSGGVALISFAAPPGTNPAGAVDAGLVEHVRVKGNRMWDNAVDISVSQPFPGSPLLGTGPGVVIEDNLCSTSDPVGHCAY